MANVNITSSTSIASIIGSMTNDEVRHCSVSGANLITDYPAALSGVSANSYVQIHITKRSSTLAEIYITAVTNQSVPYTCVGKLAGSTFHWELLALKSDITGEDISSHVSPASGCSIQYARKFGNRVLIKGTTSKITTANAYQSVATVASGYRPGSQVPGAVDCATASDFGNGQLHIIANGSIDVIYSKTTTYGLYFSVEYLIS